MLDDLRNHKYDVIILDEPVLRWECRASLWVRGGWSEAEAVNLGSGLRLRFDLAQGTGLRLRLTM